MSARAKKPGRPRGTRKATSLMHPINVRLPEDLYQALLAHTPKGESSSMVVRDALRAWFQENPLQAPETTRKSA